MNKILMATTALVAFSAAGVASAAERPTGTIGGYMFFGVGLTDNTPGGDSEIAILRDGEIHLGFKGSSDNGLTFTGRVELEAFNSDPDQIDENWAQVSGSFGSLLVGSEDTAVNSFGNVGYFCAAGCRVAYYDGFGEVPMVGATKFGDSLGLRYATPTIAGFTAAVSYHPDLSFDGAADGPRVVGGTNSAAGSYEDVFAIGGNYDGEFSGFGVSVGGGYTFGDGYGTLAGSDLSLWSIGTEIGYAGFAFGAHYEDGDFSGDDRDELALGLSYTTGPWTFAGGWTMFDSGAGAAAGEGDTYAAWASYAIAPGVAGHLAFQYGDLDANVAANDNESYNVYAIMSVGF